MIHFKQWELVDMFCKKMRTLVSTRTGTYNNADPTHYENYKGLVWVQHGYRDYYLTMGDMFDDVDEPDAPFLDSSGNRVPEEPPPIQVTVEMQDVTWGIEFKFFTDDGECGAYWSREPDHPEGGEWLRITGNFLEVFKDLLTDGDAHHPMHYECPHGTLSMYE